MSYTTDELLALAEYFEDLAADSLTKTAKEKKENPKGKKKFPFWLMKKKGPKDSKKPSSDSKKPSSDKDSKKSNPFEKKK